MAVRVETEQPTASATAPAAPGPGRPPRLQVPRSVQRRYRQAQRTSTRAERGARMLLAIPLWMFRGYNRHSAGDLAAAVAFNALVAFVPMCLLLMSVGGIILRNEDLFVDLIMTVFRGLPEGQAEPAVRTIVSARDNSTWYGLVSLVGFLWIGSNFVSCLARTMNRVYGVQGCGFACERKRGFVVIMVLAVLFLAAVIAATFPSLFINQDLPYWFESWFIAERGAQVISYVIAFWTAVLFFGTIFRVVPNAGQTLLDVWPGTLVAAGIFVIMAQVFPLYLRAFNGFEGYGQLFGFVALLVAWFYFFAHTLMFGCYVNATYHRFRHPRRSIRSSVKRLAPKDSLTVRF